MDEGFVKKATDIKITETIDEMAQENVPVRRRSSIRKSRSEAVERTARVPSQQRSRDRFEKIIDSTEELLKTSNIEDISTYDVAAKAEISPASVNYLFPTMSALWVEIGNRLLRTSTEHVLEAQRSLANEREPSWQSWLKQMATKSALHFNAHRHVSEACFGSRVSREVRLANIAVNNEVAEQCLESMKKVFIMPDIPNLAEKIALTIEACDAIWSRSYILHGHITDEARDELLRVQISYLRTFLPETLPLNQDRNTIS